MSLREYDSEWVPSIRNAVIACVMIALLPKQISFTAMQAMVPLMGGVYFGTAIAPGHDKLHMIVEGLLVRI